VLGAGTGEDALVLAASRHPDLVALDLGLPRMDGFDVARRLAGRCPRGGQRRVRSRRWCAREKHPPQDPDPHRPRYLLTVYGVGDK
jgi:CheY-like chemotaxis protein